MSDDKTLWTGVEQLSKHIKIVDAENGGRVVVVKGMKQCRYCKWYVKDNFQCTYSHVLLLPDEACEHFELKEQENEMAKENDIQNKEKEIL